MAADTPLLSPLDAAFLYFETPTQPLHVGCLTLLDAPVPFDELITLFEDRLLRLRRYRQRAVRPAFDLALPSWEDAPDFDPRRLSGDLLFFLLFEPAAGSEASFRCDAFLRPGDFVLRRFDSSSAGAASSAAGSSAGASAGSSAFFSAFGLMTDFLVSSAVNSALPSAV